MIKIIEFHKSNPFYMFYIKFVKKGLKSSSYSRSVVLLERLKVKTKINNEDIFNLVFSLLELYVFIYRKKVGSNIYSIPMSLNENVRLKKGLTNFLKVLKNKKEKTFFDKILNEILEIKKFKGSTLNARNNIYSVATAETSNTRFLRPKLRKPPLNYKKVYNRINVES